MPIKINSTGGGSVSIDVPSTGGTYTLTAPANNATIFTTAGGAITGNVAFTSNNVSIGGQTASPFGAKNKIINGGMQVWQRGTTFSWDPATSGSPYTVDRFLIARESTGQTGTATVSQYSLSSTEDPYAFGFITALKVKPTATETVAAGESTYIQTRLEGYNVADFGFGTSSASSITLSFWVKSDVKTGTMCVAFYVNNDSTNASYIAEYNITTSWQKVTIVVPGNTSVIPTVDNNGRFNLGFTLLSGSNYQTTGNTWASSYKNATSNQINMFDSTSNAFYITGIQLEKGSVATPFEFRQFSTELALCERYFERSYNYGTATGTAGGIDSGAMAGTGVDINDITTSVMYSVPKRAAPTITLYNSATGASGGLYDWTNGVNYIASGVGSGGTKGFSHISLVGSVTTPHGYSFHWTASAEL